MGGFGSGWRSEKKMTAEVCMTFDTADLKRLNLLRPGFPDRRGVIGWPAWGGTAATVGYTLVVGADGVTLWLTYHMPGHDSPTLLPVRLVTTGCHLGGRRWWFLCSLLNNGVRCVRRVRKLYLRDGHFGCRHCHRLTYMTQQLSGSKTDRARELLDFIQATRMDRGKQKNHSDKS
jgi:hypothetical protein